MSFTISPNFDALTISHSQNQKYSFQNILYYHNSRLRNFNLKGERKFSTLDIDELEKIITRVINYKGDKLEFPCHSHEKIIKHILDIIDSFLIELSIDPEIFLDNITINIPGKTIEEISYEEIRNKIGELIRDDQMVVLKMDTYMALPYNEKILNKEFNSSDFLFLKEFQEKWSISRPWRYVSVRNWIYIPKITMYGHEIYTLEPVGEYIRDLKIKILRERENINYNTIRKLYSYLRIRKYFSQKSIDTRRFQDQLIFNQFKNSNNEDEISTLLLYLETFFEESSISFLYSILCDMKVSKHINSIYSRIDPDFIQQFHQTVRYLLEKYKISYDTTILEKYIEESLKQEINIEISEIDKIFE